MEKLPLPPDKRHRFALDCVQRELADAMHAIHVSGALIRDSGAPVAACDIQALREAWRSIDTVRERVVIAGLEMDVEDKRFLLSRAKG